MNNIQMTMRSSYLMFFVLLSVLFIGCSEDVASGQGARELAKAAYHQIEGNVFKRGEFMDAMSKLRQAQKMDQNEPFVYLTESLAILVSSYMSGDWYEVDNFESGALDGAIVSAEYALTLDQNLPHTHAHLARLNIIKNDCKKAQQYLNKAQQLDSNSFYSWYFQGILHEKLSETEKAKEFFKKAELYILYNYQGLILNAHRQNVARIEGDFNNQERLLLADIEAKPDIPHNYGNYGVFLLNHGRYKEAIAQYEKAISIAPYPLAEKQLIKVRRLLKESRQNTT